MKHYFIAIALIVSIISGIILAQKKELSMESRWEKVNELAAKQLPESALKELEIIITQAEKEKNSVQLIKALVYKMRFTLERDPEKAPELIQNFESIAEKSINPTEKAMLNSMTADMYAQYYQNDAWTINKRTVVSGFIPNDIKEWTKNIYFDKITKLLDLSVQNTAVLQKTEALQYEALLEKGEDSRILQPTLFDFLMQRKINILNQISQATDLKNSLDAESYFTKANEFVKLKLDTLYSNSVENKIIATYQQLFDFHLNSKNINALIYSDLARIQYLRSQTENNELYLKALIMLEEMYSKNEAVVEIIAEKANFYLQKADETPENISAKRAAYDICEKGILLYPKYKRIDLLKNIQKTITQKSLNLELKEIARPNSALNLKLNYANIRKIEIKVYRVNASAFEYYEYLQNKRQENDEFKNKTLIETKAINLVEDLNFQNKDTTIKLTSGKFGIYEIQVDELASGNKINTAKTYFTVTNLAFMSKINVLPMLNLYVLDRQSGNPIQNVIVTSYNSKWNTSRYELKQYSKTKTDKAGLSNIRTEVDNSNFIHFFENGEDKYFSSRSISYYYSYNNQTDTSVKLQLFTDRSLYRPGQIVYFKGIAYFANKNQHKTDNNSNYEITLYNVNNEKISSKSLKTNDFGSFAGEFVLPEGGLNGAYRLESKGMSQTIWVEEYKRPTFEVKIEMPKTEIKFGEKITVFGNVKAYAGYNIGDAKVKYRVKRVSHRYCWWWSEPETEITNGEAVSDANGKFEISFIAEKPKNAANTWRGSFYTYTISADVTDPKGETQQGEQSISVGDKSLFIIASVPEKVEKNSNTKLEIYTETLNGEKINSIIDYEVYRLEDLSDYIENQDSKTESKTLEMISSGKFNTQDNALMPDMKKWKSARYKLILKTKDAFGNEVKTENIFIVYDLNDKRPPVKTYSWFLTPKTVCQVGEKAQIRFGTSTKNTMVLYEIMCGNKIIESKWLKFNDEIKDFEIPFKEEFGAGVTVMFTFMKDERFFVQQVQISRKIAETKLTLGLSVFRDKLQPGEKATWTVTIPESAKDKKAAELLVGMYDASLDAIRPHNWTFFPFFIEPIPYSTAWNASQNNNHSAYAYFNADFTDVYSYQFDNLNWFGLNLQQSLYYHRPMMIRGTKSMQNEDVMISAPVAAMVQGENGNEIVINENVAEKKSDVTGAISSIKAKTATDKLVEEEPLFTTEKPIKIRTNFNETAFFYPQLRTDAQGNVKFTFTAPESLTRWNVKMLAHTPDLFYGQAENQVITQKELMVQMNLPRFVRRSDKLILSANVINLTDKAQNASVQFELINPATEKTIKIKNLNTKSITLTANQTKAVEWEITEFSPYELVICKVVANAGNFSDGEQKYLAVLPDKVLITESLPLIIRNNETRKFKFESLIKNGSKVETQNLAVEFSANPAWYAVQALPTLSAPENENAMDYFTAYYANTLAGYIANSNPKIAATFDKWKKAGGSRDALLSNLQKNTELKNMLLEETPWVMAAKDETEQKRQIALLFDLNMQKNQNQQYLDKLIKLQTSNGGFAWFEGMPESRYITQEIMLNLARLNRITKENTNDQLQSVTYKALNYLDLEILKDFIELKKYNKDYQKQFCIGNMQMFYLHLRSEYPENPIHVSAQEAVKFYTAQSEKYWTGFTLYGKAMIALVAHRNGKIQIANNILKSLKENALKTDELGMYWAKNSAGYFWNERPIAVQAAIIEAYSEVWKNTADVDEMKIWLLKQKQTQRWDSPMATVNAIYALLLQGSNWLNNESTVKIEVGSKTLQPKEIEAGTAYFKVSIPAREVKPEMDNIIINNSSLSASKSSGIGWGAMYWQYYQDLDKIVGNGGPLKISKKLFVEKITTTGKTMLPIEQTKISKGDKIITRLVISTDRKMEFVALKDLRASCFEPVNQRSGSYWKEKLCYYQTTKDASTQFFFSFLPKGTYVFEYELWANNSGEFTSGIASVQCQYAPEFVSHSGGERIVIR